MMQVPEVTAPSCEEFYREFVVPGRPAIINQIAPWPAFGKWSLAFFREKFGEKWVQLPGGRAQLGSFIDQVGRSSPEVPSEYLNQVPLYREFPELISDISPLPQVLAPNWASSRLIPSRWGMRDSFCEFFMGGAGAGFSLLHFDDFYVNTYITQVVGDKEFTLYPREDSHLLYPDATRPNLSTVGRLSEVDPLRFPLFAQARPTHVVVREGQTIFVPRGVWHASRLRNPSIAVAMSTANGTAWRRFANEFAHDRNPVKALCKKAVLHSVGAWKRVAA